MAPPRRSDLLLTVGGLVLGVAAGWLGGLLRAPRAAGGDR